MTNKTIKYKPISPEVLEIAEEHNYHSEAVLEVLKELQDRHGGISSESIADTARVLDIPANRAFGMATFYSMLSLEERKNILRVCDGPVCWLKRASETRAAIEDYASGWTVERTSCLGLCDRAPAVLVNDEQAGPVEPADAQKVCEGWRGVATNYSKPRNGEVRVMMRLAGLVNPDEIESALENDVYSGLKSALRKTPEEVYEEVEASGLQGRGGAGFLVGRKWKFVAQAKGSPKYIICNADESEPLIFKDRVLIDTKPHQLLEGMKNIFGSGFSFKIHVHRGAGAYICGEETALIESLEGKRGEPRLRPPYPPQCGFRGKPTAVNNVESFSAVPHIMKNGVEWWKSLSIYATAGTKIYMVLGHVKNPGLFEAPFGLTLRQIIDEFGGGMTDGANFQFALCGGAAGTIVDESLLDIPIDFASSGKGISLGAGSFLICDQNVSPVAFLRELLHFFAAESCGKCTPCRVGTWRSLEILNRLAASQGWKGDSEELKTLAALMQDSSFCGLGQSVGIPMMSALKHFGSEFAKAETVEPLSVLR